MQILARLCFSIAAMAVVAAASIGATVAHAQVRIVAIGDSAVSGYGVGFGAGVGLNDAYPAKLEKALQAKGIQASVVNSGIPGDTTARVLDRLDGAVPQGTQVVVTWVGINDQRNGVSEARISANRQLITSRLKARGIEVVHLPSPGFQDVYSNLQLTTRDGHMNPAGYDQVVARTLPQIMGAIGRAKGARR